jgi:hypothetical protein
MILGPAPAAPRQTAGAADAGQAAWSGASGAPATATDARLTPVSEIPSREGGTATVAGLIVETGPGTATLDDGTGRVRLGGAAASDAISLLEPGDAVEVTGQVSRDADGWLIEVDPDRIAALAGPGSGAAGSSAGPSDGASPSAEAAASEASGLEGEAPAARGQAHGLARPAGSPAGPNPVDILPIFGGGLAMLALLGLAAALIARGGRLPRCPKRPSPLTRGPRDAGDVAPR